MQTVPPALDRGTGLPAKWETLGTEVPRKLMALAGTGHGSAEEVEETGHWTHSSASSSQDTGEPREHPTPPFHHFSIANCSQITLNIARTPTEGNHDLISPQ